MSKSINETQLLIKADLERLAELERIYCPNADNHPFMYHYVGLPTVYAKSPCISTPIEKKAMIAPKKKKIVFNFKN